MLKNLALIAAVAGSLLVVQEAQARGHRKGGCSSCCNGGGCAVQAPGKEAYTNAPPGVAPLSQPAPTAVTAAQPAPVSYAYAPARRGLFGRR
jgi:hypothetical protein